MEPTGLRLTGDLYDRKGFELEPSLALHYATIMLKTYRPMIRSPAVE